MFSPFYPDSLQEFRRLPFQMASSRIPKFDGIYEAIEDGDYNRALKLLEKRDLEKLLLTKVRLAVGELTPLLPPRSAASRRLLEPWS